MLTKKCDRCEHEIEAPDDLAGRKVECPECGDINIMPGGSGAGAAVGAAGGKPQRASPTMAASDRAAAAGYPPSTGPEQEVMRVRRAMFRAHPLVGLLLILGVIGGLMGSAYVQFSVQSPAGALGLLGLALACVVAMAVWYILTHGSTLTITNKRTMERDGLFSKNISEVLHDDIRNVQTHQTFRQRVLGIGDIGISSAGQDTFEIQVKDLPNPGKLREVIDLYRPL